MPTPSLAIPQLLVTRTRSGANVAARSDGVPTEGEERAVEMASQFGYNPIMFEAEAALAKARQRVRIEQSEAPVVTTDVREVMQAIHRMREMAGV